MSAIANAATYDRWFKIADGDQDGRVTGGDAVQWVWFYLIGLLVQCVISVDIDVIDVI